MSLRLLTKSASPTRILIPASQLSILCHLFPYLKVYDIEGQGSFSSKHPIDTFEYGTFDGVVSGLARLSWKAEGILYTAPITNILEELRQITTVADAVLEKVVFHVEAVIHEHNKIHDLLLKFERGNIHPQIFRKLVVDGAIPLGETYQVLVEFKNMLRGLPREFRKHWKPGYLILMEFEGRKQLIYDMGLVWSILQQCFPGSLLVSETIREWDLRDYESTQALRRVHAA